MTAFKAEAERLLRNADTRQEAREEIARILEENARLKGNLSKERLDALNINSMLDELEEGIKKLRDELAGRIAA